jgi:hypothetical protein
MLDTVPLHRTDWLLILGFAVTPGIAGQVARLLGNRTASANHKSTYPKSGNA